MGIYRRTFTYFRPFTKETVLALSLSLGGIVLGLLKPWPIKVLFDQVLGAAPVAEGENFIPLVEKFLELPASSQIFFLCLALIVIHLLVGSINLASNYLFVRVGLKALLRVRTEIYTHLQRLSLKFHDSSRSSDSSFRVAYDSQAIQTIYNRGLSGVFSSLLTLIGVFLIMLWMDPLLTLVSLLILPAVILTIRFFAVRIREQSTHIQERESSVLDIAQEGLRSIRMIHAFNREDHEIHQFTSKARESLRASLKFNMTSIISSLVAASLMAIGTAAMYYVGAHHVLNGTLSIGDLVVFAAYLTSLYAPLESLTYTAWALEGATAGAKRCFEILDRPDDVPEPQSPVPLKETKGEIVFQNVSFGYTPETPRILSDISYAFPPGKTTAIVGGTGAGKSTLLSMIPRFYDPTDGEIFLDDIPLKSLLKFDLREQISLVLQDTLLFSTTVRENIAYGCPNATEEDIIAAAKMACADEFIRQLPQGYASQVGERGGHLSVGQRQRIGIARAFLRNSPILLLDEPTSALDPQTEKSIMDTLYQLMADRTTLIVTHRIPTIHHADHILVLHQGKIVEAGTGPELLAQNGRYTSLYNSALQKT